MQTKIIALAEDLKSQIGNDILFYDLQIAHSKVSQSYELTIIYKGQLEGDKMPFNVQQGIVDIAHNLYLGFNLPADISIAPGFNRYRIKDDLNHIEITCSEIDDTKSIIRMYIA